MSKRQATLQGLTELLGRVSELATFNTSFIGDVTAPEFKQLYYLSTRSSTHEWAYSAKPELPEDLMAELVQHLRTLLGQYIHDDHIGNGLAYLGHPVVVPSVSDYALDVVRASVVLGPDQTALALSQWASQEPFPYRLCAILTGITGDCFLKVEQEGVSFETLPNDNWDRLRAHLPFQSIGLRLLIDTKNTVLMDSRIGGSRGLTSWPRNRSVDRLRVPALQGVHLAAK